MSASVTPSHQHTHHLASERSKLHIAAGSATAPRLCEVESVLPSPHSRLWRQYGVIDDVTAHAVNIAGYQFITLIRHLTHNRASGCNINNLTLTTSVAKSATWGKQMNPKDNNRGAVADSANEGNSRPSDAFLWASIFRGLRFAHPRLSPFGFRLRGHAFQARWRRDVCSYG